MLEFNSRQKEVQKEKKHGLVEYEPYNIALEEKFDKVQLEIFFSRNKKLIQYLFTKYANSGLKKRVEYFDTYMEKH